MKKSNPVPPYMNILFNKLYNNKVLSGIFDDERIVKLGSLGLKKKIMSDLLRDVAKNAHVLQIGLTFGDELERIYQKVRKQMCLIFLICKLNAPKKSMPAKILKS